ncbi:MAG: 1-acyl-sn-glycerol-3-phosphate acyltransferase [Burkholderiales bacterium]|nr:1-acyl-sn-glycerol-3-phosphate acyltransferase [Burkholderiales bacterium]
MSRSTERLRQFFRISGLALHIVVGLTLSGAVFPILRTAGRQACFRWWSRRLLRILRVEIHIHGDPDAIPRGQPALLLANHVSWLDVFVVRSAVECRFVAKSDIRQWPIVGWLVSKQGTVFVERARRRDTARVNASLESALLSGEKMVVFPEGTTTDGSVVKPFHASLLQPVVAVNGWAMPVALRYRYPDGRRNDQAAYTGDLSLWDSAKQIAAQRYLIADVFFLPPEQAVGQHRRDLAASTGRAVAEALSLPPPDKTRGTAADLPDAAP